MKIRLEPVEEKHIYWLRNQRNKPDVMDFCRQPFMLNEINQQDWLKDCSRNRTMVPFIVVDDDLASGNTWVGYAALSHIDWVNHHAEISYFTAPEFRDKGYAQEGIYLFLEYAFNTLNLNKIHSETFKFNEREIEFMKSLGFQVTGDRRDQYFKRGQYHDSVIIEILRPEFYSLYSERLNARNFTDSKPL